ncbi:Histone-lysine N-methyltransferase SETMAR [Melipona quadrifasciata]|uniref:Histone-lysine N-methyltransferase SETMAR n=1 Tax=Melipona quadrifasciata TaxID=166423 RepID=A0A0M9ABC7_9HYME|nr:Histone-lysine N-methyltransferase SETMAR [Melipona quadrifasciata]
MRTYRKRRYFRHIWKKVWLRYVNFCQFYIPLNMEENKVHFRHLMLFFYRKGKNATQAANRICAVYGEGAVAERTVRKWFARFKAGDFNLKDQGRPGRPSSVVLPHPPYSPDLASSDFLLFRSLQSSLNGKNFNSLVEIKNHVEKFFAKREILE